MELEPASVAMVKRLSNGRKVLIEDDVLNVVRDLQTIDPALRVRYAEEDDFFVVYRKEMQPDGSVKEKLVTTARELDQRIVKRIREIDSHDYDYGAELERVERQADRSRDHQFSERIGPHSERLAHALRQDLGLKPRIFVPGGKDA